MSLWDWILAAWLADKMSSRRSNNENEDFWGAEDSSLYDEEEFEDDF